jgi:fructose/tagatose bisphosphate aldolase
MVSARKNYYAIGALNVQNLESLSAIAEAAREENSRREFDPRKILGPTKEAMKEIAKSKMRLFGSSGKA